MRSSHESAQNCDKGDSQGEFIFLYNIHVALGKKFLNIIQSL